MPKNKKPLPVVTVWGKAWPPLDEVGQTVNINKQASNESLEITAASFINSKFNKAVRFLVPGKTKEVLVDFTGQLPMITYTAKRNLQTPGGPFPHLVLNFVFVNENEFHN